MPGPGKRVSTPLVNRCNHSERSRGNSSVVRHARVGWWSMLLAFGMGTLGISRDSEGEILSRSLSGRPSARVMIPSVLTSTSQVDPFWATVMFRSSAEWAEPLPSRS